MQVRFAGAVALAVGMMVGVAASPAAAQGGRGNDTSAELRRAVTVPGIKRHLDALQRAAQDAGGNRLGGTPGYDASAAYVASRARRAGLEVSTFEFDYDLYLLADWKPPVLSVARGTAYVPGIAGSIFGGDFGSMVNSPSGDVTAPVWAADLTLPSPAPNSSDSGCEAVDFEGMPQGAIALIQRGTCGILTKWLNAQTAGAGAIVFINEGNPEDPDRVDPLWYDVEGVGLEIPIMAAQVAMVQDLAGGVAQGVIGKTARLRVDWRTGTYPTRNVVAETRGGDPDKVIVVGAHLDSVGTGPGINDNGSGSAGILEIAAQLRGIYPRNKLRFVWFSAEESGLLGSEAYVDSLSAAERGQIAAMLNFDMIGSPNFVRFVYDGDLSDSPPPEDGVFAPEARPFSAVIEGIFARYFGRQGLATEPTDFDGRSDYGPFIEAGIPAGGLFTGAEGIKTPEQAAIFGGTAGEQYDPCYHLGCDDRSNLSDTALDQMSDAAAHATIRLAQRRTIPDRETPAPPVASRRAGSRAATGHDLPEPLQAKEGRR